MKAGVKFKVASAILTLFTLIGLTIVIYTDLESYPKTAISIMLYVLIPAYGAYGTWFKSPVAILTTLLFFITQSVRRIGYGSLIPHIAPITLSFPVGEFVNGQGYLIDCFAIFMAVFLALLFKQVAFSNKQVN